MRIPLLIILAGMFYGLGVWALLAATQHLAPGVKPQDVAGIPLGGNTETNLASLYTARGLQLRQLGMLSGLVCVIATLLLVITVASLVPSLWQAKVSADPDAVFGVVRNRPDIILVWVAELVLACMGFVVSRSRPFFAAWVLALVIIWSHELLAGFPTRDRVYASRAEHVYALQVLAGFVIALLATAQGMRSWMVRAAKRAQEPSPSV
jgi:hypothetical protein